MKHMIINIFKTANDFLKHFFREWKITKKITTTSVSLQ